MMRMRAVVAASLVAGFLGAVEGAARAEAADERVDLELVLAADISLSMDLRELSIQRAGYAAAITAPEVLDAITQGFDGRIAVAFVEWAGLADQHVTVGWHAIADEADAQAFANAILDAPLRRARRTSISAALTTAAGLFDDNGYAGFRQVIDVSGDGPNNQGDAVHQVRDRVVANGIVINGLPLMLDLLPADWYNIPDLDVYYRECVIGGPGAFYVRVQQMEEFEAALIRKLVLEIAAVEPSPLVLAQASGGYDCLVGERIWRERMRILE